MGNRQNRHGLNGYIPEKVKRAVRQQCGFGCVLCGSAFVQYDHFDPEFKDATDHRVEGIALLCPGHHADFTFKHLPRHLVAQARSNPWSLRHGFAHDFLYLEPGPPRIIVGSNVVVGSYVAISVDGDPIVWFEPPEDAGAPMRLNARFIDAAGEEIARVDRNEFKAFFTGYDVTLTGTRFTFTHKDRGVSLIMDREGGKDIRIVEARLHSGEGLFEVARDGSMTFPRGNTRITSHQSVFYGRGVALPLSHAPCDPGPSCKQRLTWHFFAASYGTPLWDASCTLRGYKILDSLFDVQGRRFGYIDDKGMVRRITGAHYGAYGDGAIVAPRELMPSGHPYYVAPRERVQANLTGRRPNITARFFGLLM